MWNQPVGIGRFHLYLQHSSHNVFPIAQLMFQLFIGSLLLSLVHATIPNHWIPVVAIGKAEKWSQRETLFVAGISGLAHTLSTVLIGITIGLIGHSLNKNYTFISEKLAPVLLIILGVIYLVIDTLAHHRHTHGEGKPGGRNRSKTAIIISLAITMFLSPCLEVEAYYFQAGALGWQGIMLVSAVYMVVTVAGMLVLVYLGIKGVQAIRSHFLDHHEKMLSGIVLVILGILALFIHF